MSYTASQKPSETRDIAVTGRKRKVQNQLLNTLMQSTGGGGSGLGTPLGILGPIFENLFGQNPSADYLGARSALQDTLSGSGAGLSTAVNGARDQLMPGTLENIRQGSEALRAGAGPLGLRFSTDLMGQQSQFAGDQFRDLNQQALGAGMNIFNQRGQAAQNIFGQIGQMGQQNNPLAAIMQLLGTRALGGFGGGGGGGAAYNGPYPGGS